MDVWKRRGGVLHRPYRRQRKSWKRSSPAEKHDIEDEQGQWSRRSRSRKMSSPVEQQADCGRRYQRRRPATVLAEGDVAASKRAEIDVEHASALQMTGCRETIGPHPILLPALAAASKAISVVPIGSGSEAQVAPVLDERPLQVIKHCYPPSAGPGKCWCGQPNTTLLVSIGSWVSFPAGPIRTQGQHARLSVNLHPTFKGPLAPVLRQHALPCATNSGLRRGCWLLRYRSYSSCCL